MNEFINILEVDKLPLNAIDRFIGVDKDGNVKSSSVVIDAMLDTESDNAISNKVVANAIADIESTIGDIDTMLLDIIG